MNLDHTSFITHQPWRSRRTPPGGEHCQGKESSTENRAADNFLMGCNIIRERGKILWHMIWQYRYRGFFIYQGCF